MNDRTGKKLEAGQIVDVYAEGFLSAVVVKVEEPGAIINAGHPRNGVLIVQVGIPFEVLPDEAAPCYIVKDKPKDPSKLKKVN